MTQNWPIAGFGNQVNSGNTGMRLDRQIATTVMIIAAFAVITAIILMRPAARMVRHDSLAQSAALSSALTTLHSH